MRFSFTQGVIIMTAAFALLVLGFMQHKPSHVPVPRPPTQTGVPAPGFKGVEEKEVIAPTEDGETIDISDWVEYRNEKFGFLFTYPTGWELHDGGIGLIAAAPSLERVASEGRAINMFWPTGREEDISERIDIVFSAGEYERENFRSNIVERNGVSIVDEVAWGEGVWVYYLRPSYWNGKPSQEYVAQGFNPNILGIVKGNDLRVSIIGMTFAGAEVPGHVIDVVRLIGSTFEFIEPDSGFTAQGGEVSFASPDFGYRVRHDEALVPTSHAFRDDWESIDLQSDDAWIISIKMTNPSSWMGQFTCGQLLGLYLDTLPFGSVLLGDIPAVEFRLPDGYCDGAGGCSDPVRTISFCASGSRHDFIVRGYDNVIANAQFNAILSTFELID